MTGHQSFGAPKSVRVVHPGEGEVAHLLPGISVIFKLTGEDTGGALAIVDHPFEVGALVPPHIHHLEDEISIVLEGEIGFRSNNKEVVLGAGGFIFKPRGEVHAMWNAGSARGRIVEIVTPAGFEQFFRELGELGEAGPPDPAAVAELGSRYDLLVAEPEWLPDVIARYNLAVPAPPGDGGAPN
ncbi:MAG: cupin domain-containing protein [Candidatus Limnocylindria bacterium]